MEKVYCEKCKINVKKINFAEHEKTESHRININKFSNSLNKSIFECLNITVKNNKPI